MDAKSLFKKPKPIEEIGPRNPGVFPPFAKPTVDEVKAEWSGCDYTTDDLIDEVCRRLDAKKPAPDRYPEPPLF